MRRVYSTIDPNGLIWDYEGQIPAAMFSYDGASAHRDPATFYVWGGYNGASTTVNNYTVGTVDGLSWQFVNKSPNGDGWPQQYQSVIGYSEAFFNGTFYKLSGYNTTTGPDFSIWTSIDGSTWVNRQIEMGSPIMPNTGDWYAGKGGNGTFYVTGFYNYQFTYNTTDGVNWYKYTPNLYGAYTTQIGNLYNEYYKLFNLL